MRWHWLSAFSKSLGLRHKRPGRRPISRPRLRLERLENRATPAIQSITPTPALLTDAQVGNDTFALAVTFTEEMNPASTPVFTFDSAGATATAVFSSGSWSANNTVYTALFDVTDAGVEVADVDVTIAGTLEADAGTSDGTVADVFDIDTLNPTVTDVTVSDTLLTDADGTTAFTVTVTFSEAMNNTVNPTLTFDPALASTLTFGSGAWSVGDTVYTATYTRADGNVRVDDVDVQVAAAQDAAGNVQAAFTEADAFDVDTQNPTVSSVAVNDTLHTDADVANPFTVTVTYAEAMNPAVNPTITFDPTVGGALVFSSGAWSAGNTVYTATYTRADTNARVDDVDVVVTGGQDANGNAQTAGFTQADAFDVDTQNPTPGAVTPNFTIVSDAQVGTGTFKLTVTFAEDMNTAVNPTLTFPTTGENPGASLTGASGAWTDARTFVVTYNVTDQNVRIPNIDVRVSGGQDLAGNGTIAATLNNVFTIDTQAPTVTTVVPRFSTIIPGHENRQYTLTITFSEAMNNTVNPSVTFVGSNVSSVLTFASGVWTSPTTYVAVYNQTAAAVTIRNSGVRVTGATDVGGIAQATGEFSNVFSIDRQPATVVSVTPSVQAITDARVGQTFTLTIVFSEPMSTTSRAIVNFPGGLSSTLTFLSRSWTNNTTHVVTYTVADTNVAYDGRTLTVRLAREASQNRQTAGTFNDVFTVDTGNPTVQDIGLLDPSPTTADSVRFQVVFREAVTGVDAADFAALGVTGATVTGVSATSTSVYIVTVSPGSGSGQLRLQVQDNNTIRDLAGNLLGGPTTDDGDFTSDVAYDITGDSTSTTA